MGTGIRYSCNSCNWDYWDLDDIIFYIDDKLDYIDECIASGILHEENKIAVKKSPITGRLISRYCKHCNKLVKFYIINKNKSGLDLKETRSLINELSTNKLNKIIFALNEKREILFDKIDSTNNQCPRCNNKTLELSQLKFCPNCNKGILNSELIQI